MVMMISDETGEGKMTVHQILPGIMICFTDMHMEQCMSEFELNSGQKENVSGSSKAGTV